MSIPLIFIFLRIEPDFIDVRGEDIRKENTPSAAFLKSSLVFLPYTLTLMSAAWERKEYFFSLIPLFCHFAENGNPF